MGLLDEFLLPDPQPVVEQPKASILEALGVSSRNVEGFVAGGAVSGKTVGHSRDLARVLELPRRARPVSFDEYRAEFEHLKKHPISCVCQSQYNRRCPTNLLDTQAWTLHEIGQHRGILGAIAVGEGKSLLDLLAALVMPECRVAVLLIPPQLRDQMLNVDWHFYGQHWDLPNLGSGAWFDPKKPTLHIIAYSELSSAKNSDVLERIKPDLIIADEAHMLRNAGTARTKRFKRYFAAHPETRFLCWSGTLTTKSIKDYAHLAELALREGSPLPLHWPTVEEWAGAIDVSDWPSNIGALSALCENGEHIREGFRRRREETAGSISSPATMNCPASLLFTERKTVAPTSIHDALRDLYGTWRRPDGEELVSALDVARAAKEISAGFYYHWIWPRNEPEPVRREWLAVRKEYHKEMREKLKQSKEFMDSPLLLVRAAMRWHDGYTHIERDTNGHEIRRVEIPPFTKNGPQPVWQSGMWPQWKLVRDTAKPETEGVWIDDWLARDAAEWCKAGVGICWYEHDLFGRRVAELGGVPHFGAGADASARILDERGLRSVVASIRAHGTGKNLQSFARNLVANCPSDAAAWEQLLGRTHRQGQLADEVTVEVYRHTPVLIEALSKAKLYAGYIEGTMGGAQKLLRATYAF